MGIAWPWTRRPCLVLIGLCLAATVLFAYPIPSKYRRRMRTLRNLRGHLPRPLMMLQPTLDVYCCEVSLFSDLRFDGTSRYLNRSVM
ncbi:hypothetical protein BGZ61DRAFT_139235 [Ilyonectria robusta]|uniref:uncharacterized protein n=1 Tax=Ilyonectria robusta TaxID=1079257 RepID=UPI001E8CEFF4|nr:uncharacterized protein BGZ61DRAFT_139235 [Ilyonectria robusta]KAH8735351.1 hypothetical protein BGZ61DRAFT_139235 [Ilyonectria robusta]